jgi:DNA processing protein
VRNVAAAGVNALLAEGRTPARDVDDVLVALGLSAGRLRGDRAESRVRPSEADQQVLDAMGWQPVALDQLAVRTGLLLADLAAALDRLHTTGWIAQHGGWYERIAADIPRGLV